MNEYQVVLRACGQEKLQVIKALKDGLGIELKAAKELTDFLPCIVLTTLDKSKAENLKSAINVLGGTAVVEGGPKEQSSKKQNKDVFVPTGIVDILKKYRNIWHGDIDNISFAVCPVPEHLSAEARRHFELGRDESILFYYKDEGFWAGQRSFTVITENGICGQNSEDEELLFIPWSGVKEVQYKEYCLDFFDYEGEYWHWGIGMFTKDTTPEQGKRLAKVFNECAQIVEPEIDPYEEILKLENEEKYDDALQLLEQSASSGSIAKNSDYHFLKGRLLVRRERTLDEHLDENFRIIDKEFEKAVELSEDKDTVGYCNYWFAYYYHYTGKYFIARNTFILAMEANSEEMRDNATEMVTLEEDNLADIWNNYTSKYEYKDRKFIMPIKDRDIAGCFVDGIDTFRLSNVPSCIKFPTGHPVANELYIGHPYNSSIYVPYSESEDIFFLDKIDELTYLLQCLGAEEIEITSIKGKSVSEYENRSGQVSAHLDNGLADVNGTYGKSSKTDRSRDSQLQQSFKIKCDPMKYPYVPEGLIWYGEQTRWQRMVEGRLNGNRLEYSESISSTDTRFVSNTEKKDIKAAAEYLWIKADGSAESNLETQFKEHTETQWRVDVKFRSLRDFSSNQGANQSAEILNSDEQEYLDELKATLEDGEIGPRERKSLERARVRLGISEARAAEIEASVSAPKLTDEEKEYLAEVKAMLEDGEIGPRERKSLERTRNRLGISEERAKEIEKI